MTPQALLPSPFVRCAVHGERAILLDLRQERYYSLNEVGTRVWSLLAEGAETPTIVARLADEYDASGDRIELDVTSLVTHLTNLEMLVAAETQGQAPPPVVSTGRATLSSPCGSLRPVSALVCTVVLIAVTIALRLLGLRQSLGLASRFTRWAPAAESPSSDFLAAIVKQVDTAAAFFPGRALCLEQSLALFVCLRRAGVPVELRIGVQPYPFAAHAWVEYQGNLVGDTHDRVGKFVPFEDLGVA
jgi:hypothetical protein